jgi:hypothetical protein
MLHWKMATPVAVLTSVLSLAACGGGGRPGYSPESSAPELTWNAAPPTYTANASITVSVTATATQGVRDVIVLCGSQRWSAGLQADGSWQATVTLPNLGKNTVIVWAEDKSSPSPNTGQGLGPPYQLTQDIIYDPTPPSVTYDASYASYTDERGVELEVDANGVAKVPAKYTIGPRYGIPLGGHIYKASTRLSAGTGMTAQELETTNTENIPVLRFMVPYDPSSASPISTPKYSAQVTCPSPCPEFEPALGELLPSATPSDAQALFDLPLSTETVPALAQVQGTATISITLTLADAAGNTRTVPGFNFLFHVVGPPVAIAEDRGYAAALRTESIFAYHLADNTYQKMWTANSFPAEKVRLVRYLITNPTPEPVAVQLSYAQDAGGSWRAIETWGRSSIKVSYAYGKPNTNLSDPNSSFTYQVDGFTYREPYWDAVPGAPPSCAPNWYAHRLGDPQNTFSCFMTQPQVVLQGLDETLAVSTSSISILTYRIAPELGGQEVTAELDGTGQWVLVPAAVGAVPGALVTYLARPTSAPRTRALIWNQTRVQEFDEGYNHYQLADYLAWLYVLGTNNRHVYVGSYQYAYLMSAEDHVYGVMLGATHPYRSETGPFGETTERVSVALARAPLMTH